MVQPKQDSSLNLLNKFKEDSRYSKLYVDVTEEEELKIKQVMYELDIDEDHLKAGFYCEQLKRIVHEGNTALLDEYLSLKEWYFRVLPQQLYTTMADMDEVDHALDSMDKSLTRALDSAAAFSQSKPTWAELNNKVPKLEQQYDAAKSQLQRMITFSEQVTMDFAEEAHQGYLYHRAYCLLMVAIHIPEPFNNHDSSHVQYINQFISDCLNNEAYNNEGTLNQSVRYVDTLEELIETFFKQESFTQLVQIKEKAQYRTSKLSNFKTHIRQIIERMQGNIRMYFWTIFYLFKRALFELSIKKMNQNKNKKQ